MPALAEVPVCPSRDARLGSCDRFDHDRHSETKLIHRTARDRIIGTIDDDPRARGRTRPTSGVGLATDRLDVRLASVPREDRHERRRIDDHFGRPFSSNRSRRGRDQGSRAATEPDSTCDLEDPRPGAKSARNRSSRSRTASVTAAVIDSPVRSASSLTQPIRVRVLDVQAHGGNLPSDGRLLSMYAYGSRPNQTAESPAPTMTSRSPAPTRANGHFLALLGVADPRLEVVVDACSSSAVGASNAFAPS